MAAAAQVAVAVGPTEACRIFDVPRSSYYRRTKPKMHGPKPRPAAHPRGVGDGERAEILQVCHSSRFVDESPATIVATLLDEGRYLGSERTLYRVLAAQGESGERRRQLTHPPYVRPELLATSNRGSTISAARSTLL